MVTQVARYTLELVMNNTLCNAAFGIEHPYREHHCFDIDPVSAARIDDVIMIRRYLLLATRLLGIPPISR